MNFLAGVAKRIMLGGGGGDFGGVVPLSIALIYVNKLSRTRISKQISIAIISFVKNVVTKREEITFEVKVRGQIGWGNVIFDS